MKNKSLLRTKRRQRDVQKAKERRQRRQTRKERSPVSMKSFTLADFNFWKAHGINYLLSDYKTGTWTPSFPAIYEGGSILGSKELVQEIMARFNSAASSKWPVEGKVALAWAVQEKSSVFIYYKEAVRRLRANDPSCNPEEVCREPHNGIVWQLFDFLKTKIIQAKNPISDPPVR